MVVVNVPFEFSTASRILFGAGTIAQIGTQARSMGCHALLVTGRNAARAEPVRALLEASGVGVVLFRGAGEPTIGMVEECVGRARAEHCDLVIGFGGGSALDTAKAVAVLLTNDGAPLNYLEVIGGGQPIARPGAPCIAVPTTSGSGAEVTKNAVLASPVHKVKASLRGPFLLPRLAIVDPELTYGVPPPVTATTGLDALTQLIEPYVCTRANPLTDGFCLTGMRLVARSLHRAWKNGRDIAAREGMALASLFGGLALANAGLGAVHGFAAPIGAAFSAPHGAVCAALLPAVMEVNVRALRARQPHADALARYQVVAEILTDRKGATPEEGAVWIRELCVALGVAGLSAHGLTASDVPVLVDKAAKASSMKANPISLTVPELEEILRRGHP